MGTKKCCVGGCNATSETHRLFSFPKNDELRNLWMSFLVPTNSLLIGLSKEQLLRKRVCEKHFDKYQFDHDGRRLRYSYPCLFTHKEIAHGVPLCVAGWNVTLEHNYSKEQDEGADPSTLITITGRNTTIEHDYFKEQDENNVTKSTVVTGSAADIGKFPEHPSCSSFSTDTSNIDLNDLMLEQPSCSGMSHAVNAEVVLHKTQPPKQTRRNTTIEHDFFKEQDENNVTKSTVVTGSPADIGKFPEHPSCSSFPTDTSNIDLKDLMLEQPSCSGMSHAVNAEVVLHKTQTPKQTSSAVRKLQCNRKFMKNVTQIATENSSHSAAQRLSKALYIDKEQLFHKFNLLNRQARIFLLMQLKQVQKSKMARRFSLEEKLLALLLMKQSPKGYRLLEKIFALPNKRTLIRLSEKVSMEPGLNPQIFEHISRTCQNWDIQQKLCTVVFDEVAITPHLTFSEKKDKIVGFVDLAGERKLKYSDHALVFMVRGICSPWRQSIAYYFCEGTVSAAELQNILKQMVSQIALTGLIPLGLVCDQGSTFRTALKILREDTIKSRNIQCVHDDGSVNISGYDVSVFHDPPHLLKGLRNNFMTKDIIWEGKTASWKDIEFVFDIDSKLGHTKALPKLTAHHVDPRKMKKMKVSVAAQVLSARMAAMLKYTNAVNSLHSGENNSTMATTAEVVEFFDKLFDSVNGYPGGSKAGKLRRAVKEDSPHLTFWVDSIKKLKSLHYIDASSKHALQLGKPRLVKVPSLQGWITTLESFLRISKLLFNKYGVVYYYPRRINQDPLENFFGRLRALNSRNVNPDPNTFIYAFKSLLITNLLSPHSKYANCEEDEGNSIVTIKCLFENENKENMEDNKQIPSSSRGQELLSSLQECPKENILVDQVILEKVRVHCSAYTAGYVCRKISKLVKCEACLQTYTTKNEENIHTYIKFREFKSLKNNNLVYPTEKLLILYRDITTLIHSYLNVNCYKNNIKSNLKKRILNTIRFSWLGCAEHRKIVINTFVNVLLRLQVHNWCNIINKILKGAVEEKYICKMGEPQKRALIKYKSFRLRKKCLNK